MRDYTPRAFDRAGGTLEIDFALHEAGPATQWAWSASPGDLLEIGGPKGSSIVTDDFDWYLLIGDETALPAIGRRVEELRPGVPVTSLVVVDSAAEQQTFSGQSDHRAKWVYREAPSLDNADLLLAALQGFEPPAGDGYVWIAAEAQVARRVRAYAIDVLRHPKAWTKAAGYWTRGHVATHEKIDD